MDWITQMLNLTRRRAYSLPLPKITGDVQIPAGWKVVWKWENVMLCHSWEPVWAKNGHNFDHLLQNSSGNMSCILATSLMHELYQLCMTYVFHCHEMRLHCIFTEQNSWENFKTPWIFEKFYLQHCGQLNQDIFFLFNSCSK